MGLIYIKLWSSCCTVSNLGSFDILHSSTHRYYKLVFTETSYDYRQELVSYSDLLPYCIRTLPRPPYIWTSFCSPCKTHLFHCVVWKLNVLISFWLTRPPNSCGRNPVHNPSCVETSGPVGAYSSTSPQQRKKIKRRKNKRKKKEK